jgi:hypothetical protein
MHSLQFRLTGFFDWKIVAISSEGEASTVQVTEPVPAEEIHRLSAAGLFPAGPSAAPSPVASSIRTDSTGETLLQGGAAGKAAHGRFIVHKQGLREEQFHEIIVDLEGMKFNESGEIIRHGTFADLTAKLADLKGAYALSMLSVLRFATTSCFVQGMACLLSMSWEQSNVTTRGERRMRRHRGMRT